MRQLKKNYLRVIEQKNEAAIKSGRSPDDIRLVAVTKGVPPSSIVELHTLGQKTFGENYVQEWKTKQEDVSILECPELEWHFIGHLQTNKMKYTVGKISLFESIDRLSLAKSIDETARKNNVFCEGLLEVNLANEESKTGASFNDLVEIIIGCDVLNNLKLKGLMVLPPYFEDPEKSRPYFVQLKNLLESINQKKIYKYPLTELSMGTSHDFEVAIEEGATLVRVGRKIFHGK